MGGHHDFALAHREMHQGTAGESQQRFHQTALGGWVPVEAVLIDGIPYALGEIRFQFGGGHGNAIDEQHQVQRILWVVRGVTHLAHHAQAVGGVGLLDGRVDAQCRFELHQGKRLLDAEYFHTPAQHLQGALLVQAFAHPLGQNLGQAGPMCLGERLPTIGLGGFNPAQQVGQEQRILPVVVGGIAFGVEPAVLAQVLADGGFEMVFLVDGVDHGGR